MTSLLAGIVLGLSSGFAPGPLLTFVINQTLRHNIKEGIKVALSPLITDLPVIFLAAFVLNKLKDFQFVLGIFSFLGGLFVLYLALENFKTAPLHPETEHTPPGSLKKGVIVNALNPHVYLFWFGVGVPAVLKAKEESVIAAIAFITCFYLFLIGSKILLAVITGRSRAFLEGKTYLYALRIMGALLFIFALLFLKNSLVLLGIVQ
ncbi:MAG: LysE family transporter [Firmicutes bacterium]|nr:LysE family transporter [Bacillota bacterium]